MSLIYFLDSAGGSVHCLIILYEVGAKPKAPQGLGASQAMRTNKQTRGPK